MYVRRVNFNGTSGVNDEVFRREMRQLEGAYLSNAAVERSKQRIQRLPFIEKVDVETNPVPGAADLVDVDFEIEEGLPGQFGGGVGYSESQSVILNGNFVHSNFMGTGNRIAAEINSGRYSKAFSFSHTDPYTTIDGVQRTISLGYRDITQFTSATSDFDTETHHARPRLRLSDHRVSSTSASASRRSAPSWSRADGGSADEAIDWVRNNGNHATRARVRRRRRLRRPVRVRSVSSEFDTFELNLGWRYDSRNRAIFADRGARHRFNVGYTAAGQRRRILDRVATTTCSSCRSGAASRSMFNLEARLRQGARRHDGAAAVPPVSSPAARTRCAATARAGSGPKDNFGRPYGGNIKTVAQTELLLPMPEKWRNSARFSLFYDIGNVFSDQDIVFVGPPDRRDRNRAAPSTTTSAMMS